MCGITDPAHGRLAGSFPRGGGTARARERAKSRSHTHAVPLQRVCMGVAGVDRGDRGCQCSIGEGAKGVSAGDTPAPHSASNPRCAGSLAGVLYLDGVRRHRRHGQAVAVMPPDAGRKPCHAGIRDAPDGKADRVVNRDSEVRPGAPPDKAGSDSQCQDNCLSLVHAMRRGSK